MIGKWSDILDVSIKHLNTSDLELVIIWSIKVAEEGVHLCSRPSDNLQHSVGK